MLDPADRSPDPAKFPAWRVAPEPDELAAEVELPLAAWQIVEVDGEVTRVTEEAAAPTGETPLRISDRADDIVQQLRGGNRMPTQEFSTLMPPLKPGERA